MQRLAVTQRVVENESYADRRDALSQDWARFLEPLLPTVAAVPVPNRLSDASRWLDALECDALLLSNGNDWGQAEDRDRLETEAFRHFRSRGLPILGVCRGIHVINVLAGGTLVADVAKLAGTSHVARDHEVVLEPGPFAAMAGGPRLTVNSYHDQGVSVDGVGEELRPFAVAEGGIVEGLYHEREPILGIQWHPERTDPAAVFDADLIRTFLSRGAFWREGGGA